MYIIIFTSDNKDLKRVTSAVGFEIFTATGLDLDIIFPRTTYENSPDPSKFFSDESNKKKYRI